MQIQETRTNTLPGLQSCLLRILLLIVSTGISFPPLNAQTAPKLVGCPDLRGVYLIGLGPKKIEIRQPDCKTISFIKSSGDGKITDTLIIIDKQTPIINEAGKPVGARLASFEMEPHPALIVGNGIDSVILLGSKYELDADGNLLMSFLTPFSDLPIALYPSQEYVASYTASDKALLQRLEPETHLDGLNFYNCGDDKVFIKNMERVLLTNEHMQVFDAAGHVKFKWQDVNSIKIIDAPLYRYLELEWKDGSCGEPFMNLYFKNDETRKAWAQDLRSLVEAKGGTLKK